MAGSPSEVCKVERKKVFFQNLIPARAGLKKKSSGQWIGNKIIFHVGLVPKYSREYSFILVT